MRSELSPIRFSALSVDFDGRFRLEDIDWEILPGEHWLIVGANGSGKSALAAVLAGFGKRLSGSIGGLPERVSIVSYEAQSELIEAERRKDDADILDVISEGTPARELLHLDDARPDADPNADSGADPDADADRAADPELARALVAKFGMEPVLDRAFRKLSTGETRKLLLIRALSSRPDLLVLDEPYDGLDAATFAMLQAHLAELSATVQIVLVLNRFDEAPPWVSDFAYVDAGRLHHRVRRDDDQAYAELHQLLHLKTSDLEVPTADPVNRLPPLEPTEPLVRLTAASIRYGDTVIFEGIDWTIERNQHWQLSGPNGSGKTALLSLITGDHPQCYVNDILVFGYRRGSGESIWQIKQYIGYVSTVLQWEYRVGTSLRHVIISGFHDSIGLYTKYTDAQRRIADEWLALLGMSGRANEPFNRLSYGDQRLLLIARAMVKHPPLLILDEPCLGLDDMNRQLVFALIEKICAGSETAVLYVNHHVEDRIAGIDNHLALGGRIKR